ncbi:hypothetical protein ER308_08420 [Egibacter rhizosphaerae]|uniref:Uncharacterized protein n=1 Tax=Egibacter rhizosphaerae TaxID=1670831 RepID=A0A411YEM4_9ACTN|nr:hypothetical protein [Egibacter rhizosphaerae]QBI19572.1 hypothetical protein ER308_08420 [Egibacter rhizosphaerae]
MDDPPTTGHDDADLVDVVGLVTRVDLPGMFERWWVVLGPGAEQPTEAADWGGSLVVVERGRLEVDCEAGGRRTFRADDLLVLGWLPLRAVRNPGHVPTRLVAVRRRRDRPASRLLDVIESIRRQRAALELLRAPGRR